jgi:hypothetical protein
MRIGLVGADVFPAEAARLAQANGSELSLDLDDLGLSETRRAA